MNYNRPFSFKVWIAILLVVTLSLNAVTAHSGSIQRTLGLSSNVEQVNRNLDSDLLDLLILHGKLVDGTGKKPRIADVGIRGDRIVFVGDSQKAKVKAVRTIDATGLVIAPGFIDPHTHTISDLNDAKRKSNEAFLMQGVTTVVTGNDGGSVLNIGETLAKWDSQGIGTNAILLAGQGTIRGRVMGSTDAKPNSAQLEEMKAMVAQELDEGAFGLSTGLYYSPGSYSTTEEVIELAKAAATRGGIYDTHLRDESSYSIGLLESIKEAIQIAREAKIPVHISHIKALGPELWGKSKEAIRIMKKARSDGVVVSACQYPYTASGTGLQAALMPRWAEVDGRNEMLKRIDDPQTRSRLASELDVNLKRRGGADSILITGARDPQYIGKRLSEIARDVGKSSIDTAFDLIKTGTVDVASFNMNEKDIDRLMKQDFITTCSDGTNGHPRKYGTFPRKLREYVYNKRLINLSFMIRNSSWATAETFRIPERGMIREGYFADIIIFDEKTVTDRSTYEQPELLAVGMKFVIVNGRIAVENSAFTGVLAGRALRKHSSVQ